MFFNHLLAPTMTTNNAHNGMTSQSSWSLRFDILKRINSRIAVYKRDVTLKKSILILCTKAIVVLM